MDGLRQQLDQIRQLLVSSPVENHEVAVRALEDAALWLADWKTNQAEASGRPSTEAVAVAEDVRHQLIAIRALMEEPVQFWSGLRAAGSAGYGSYERSGAVRNLASAKRTLASL
jgi:hypothetical protein